MKQDELESFIKNLKELEQKAKLGMDCGVIFSIRDTTRNIIYSSAFGAFDEEIIASVSKGIENLFGGMERRLN